MKLYGIEYSSPQPCPGCNRHDTRMFIYGDTDRRTTAEHLDKALCVNCFQPVAFPLVDEWLRIIIPWYGVDLDGTLAKMITPDTIDQVGAPIMRMVEHVRQMLEEGKDVRIFTARVACSGAYSTWSHRVDDWHFANDQRKVIDEFCLTYFGRLLPITATKDFGCVAIYDDIAKQVVRDTGLLVEEQCHRFLADAIENGVALG